MSDDKLNDTEPEILVDGKINPPDESAKDNGEDTAASAEPVAIQRAPLDPKRAMFHMVTPSLMADVLAILKRLPYEEVARIMPALTQSPIHQAPPGG